MMLKVFGGNDEPIRGSRDRGGRRGTIYQQQPPYDPMTLPHPSQIILSSSSALTNHRPDQRCYLLASVLP